MRGRLNLNTERREFYELLGHTGASQTDAACLMAEDVDWNQRTISYCDGSSREPGAPAPALPHGNTKIERLEL